MPKGGDAVSFGVKPYNDGSGNTYDVRVSPAEIRIEQAGSTVSVTEEDWPELIRKIEAVRDFFSSGAIR